MANRIGALTLFKRETKRFLKVYTQTLLSPVISNLLYLAIFGLSLRSSVQVSGGVSYLQFLIPGLVIMGIINNSFQNTSSSIVIMRYQGLLSDLMRIPLTKMEILCAMISSAVLRGLIVGSITLLTGLFFVSFGDYSPLIVLSTSILVAFFFSFLGMITGIWATEFDKIAFFTNFVLTPLIFLGGVFYPISSLPEPFRSISAANPLVYMIDLLRYGFTGYHDFPIAVSFSVIIVAVIAAGSFAYYLLKIGYRLQD